MGKRRKEGLSPAVRNAMQDRLKNLAGKGGRKGSMPIGGFSGVAKRPGFSNVGTAGLANQGSPTGANARGTKWQARGTKWQNARKTR